NWIDLPSYVIDACPNLKYIIAPASGYDYIDYKHAANRGIKVLNCPTFASHAVAEHALSLLFATARKLPLAVTSLRNGEWLAKESLRGVELAGQKLSVIGYGRI